MKLINEIVELLSNFSGVQFYHKDDSFLLFSIDDLGCLVSTEHGWDHVAVSHRDRTPTYQEMKLMKRLCFLDTEWAYELHPPPGEYISIHANALHIWRPQDGPWREPPVEVFMNPAATTTKVVI